MTPEGYQAPLQALGVTSSAWKEGIGIDHPVKGTHRGYADVILRFSLFLTLSVSLLYSQLLPGGSPPGSGGAGPPGQPGPIHVPMPPGPVRYNLFIELTVLIFYRQLCSYLLFDSHGDSSSEIFP